MRPFVAFDGEWERLPSRQQLKAGEDALLACPNCGARWIETDLRWERKDCPQCGLSQRKNNYWLAIREPAAAK